MTIGFRFCAFAMLAVVAGTAHAAPTYKLTNTIALGAPDRWDYLTFDSGAKRVYVSHGDEVTVVDGKSGAIVGNIANLPGSHGIAIVDKRGVADSAKNQQVTFFDSDTLNPQGMAQSGADADGIVYDALSGRAFVANGDASTLTVLDMKAGKFVGSIALGGQPEFLAADGAGHVFVNLESTSEIAKVDAKALSVAARFAIPDCKSPHGIALDTASHRIFTSCVNEKMVVVDADSGKILATLPIGKYTDAAAFDPVRKLAFASCGDGTIAIVAEKSANDFEAAGSVTTTRGARTMTIDPASGRLFVVTADIDHVDPPKAEGGRPHVVYKPGTVKLYFYDPVE